MIGVVRRCLERVLRGRAPLFVHLHNHGTGGTVIAAILVPAGVRGGSRAVDRHRRRGAGRLRPSRDSGAVVVVVVNGTTASAVAGSCSRLDVSGAVRSLHGLADQVPRVENAYGRERNTRMNTGLIRSTYQVGRRRAIAPVLRENRIPKRENTALLTREIRMALSHPAPSVTRQLALYKQH